jgi:hypothetical protein
MSRPGPGCREQQGDRTMPAKKKAVKKVAAKPAKKVAKKK